MAVLVNIVSDYSGWIYAACAVAALFLLRTALMARKERHQAAFTLERETATNRIHSTLRWAILVLAIMGLTYVVSTYLSKAVEPIIAEADPTPTPVFLIDTPTPTAAPVTPTVAESATETPTPRPRATPRPTPTEPPHNATPRQASGGGAKLCRRPGGHPGARHGPTDQWPSTIDRHCGDRWLQLLQDRGQASLRSRRLRFLSSSGCVGNQWPAGHPGILPAARRATICFVW